MTIRRAEPGDSRLLAMLMNAAGEGIPAYLWSQSAAPEEDAMAHGAKRAAQTGGGFSYANAHVAVIGDAVAGMLLSYRLPDPYVSEPLQEYPKVVRPAIELEAQAPGTWYINAVATLSAFRGRGIGTRLMRFAEELARNSGAPALSLIVAEENKVAKRLYEQLGYQTIARRATVAFPGCPHEGDWLLMRKAVE